MAGSFKDLVAWQKAMDLVELVYRSSENFPKHEIYGLSNQVRRAAVSVPSNIAEGQARFCRNDFRHFLRISRGSLAELETQILIGCRLGYIDATSAETIQHQIKELGRILAGLISSMSTAERS
jgi:four helix bundle protein